MKTFLFTAVLGILIFGGCSAKEFNDGIDSITSDTTKKFDEGKDKSAK